MRIMLDATMVKSGQAGVRTYVLGLAKALAGLPGVELTVLVSRFNDDDWGDAPTLRTSLRRQDPYSRGIWRQVHVPRLARQVHAEALLVPSPEPVHAPGIPQGIVVHDLGPVIAPSLYGRQRQLRYAATLRGSLALADIVFTPSVSTKLDVLRWAGSRRRAIVVAGPELVPAPGATRDRPPTEDFALYVGTVLPHKNVQPVVECFLSPERGASDTLARLVMIGPDYGGEVARVMAATHGSTAVEHRGFVPERERDRLYDAARVVVFPSLFEGFGLPLLESMARGTPLAVSDIAALREVGGDRVTFVQDPTDPGEWRAAMQAAAARPRTPAGLVSWDRCARAVRDALAAP